MTADPLDVLVLLGGSVAVCAGLPLLYAWWQTSISLFLLYVHTATMLTMGGLLGAIFIIPLYDDVGVLGGQVTYAAFMYSVLLTVFVGRDVRVVRNIILLTIAVNVVKYALFAVAHYALTTDKILNPYDTSPGIFDQSLRVVAAGGTLIILELVLLLALLEWAKSRLHAWGMRLTYVAAFIGILLLDGVLFPIVVLGPQGDALGAIAAGVQAKAVLAALFAVPLAAFVVLDRRHLQLFESTPLRLSYLVTTPPANLITLLERQQEQIAEQRASLDLSTEQIGEARATVDSLLDSASTTVLIGMDRSLRVTHFSAGAANILGYEADDVVGNEVQMLLERTEVRRLADSVGRPDAGLAALLETLASTGRRVDWSFRTLAGEARTLSISVSAIDTVQGVIGYVLAGEDVTERLQATRALAETLEREQQSLARLQGADRLRNEMVSTVSHELSTPVTSINGFLEMLRMEEQGLSERQRDAVERALRGTARLRRLVEDLRLIAQVDTGDRAVDRVELDLREVAESCRERIEDSLSSRALALEWEMPDDAVRVLGDLETLREVVLRLVGNAVKFTPDGGRVGVAVGSVEDRGVLTVSDTGIGIAEQDQRRIFNRFERGAGAQERAIEGAGLGLSIVSTVVNRHGGDIEINSAPEEGTTIRVVLPLTGRAG